MNSVVWRYERGRGGRENGDCKEEDEGRKLKKRKKKQKWRRGAQRGEQLQQKRGERAVAVWLR